MLPAPAPASIMMIAGEPSGDLHGAGVVRALRKRVPGMRVFGIGGNRLREAGMRLSLHADTLSVMGISEVVTRWGAVRLGLKTARRLLETHRPDLLILIDFPDFNLRVAAIARRLGVPVLYYISPKIWAWRTGRVNTIRQRVDRMAVILPFETDFYQKHGIPVTFVGNPVLDIPAYQGLSCPEHREGTPFVIGFLPGSREMEMKRHLPVCLDTAKLIHHRRPETRFIVSLVPALDREPYRGRLAEAAKEIPLEVVSAPVREVFRKSHLLVAASGTVTLEAAVCGCPMVVIYKLSPLSYRVGKALVRVPYISLVNLIAREKVVPELIQEAAEAPSIAFEVLRSMDDPERLSRVRSRLLDVRKRLGAPGAGERTADLALQLLSGSR